MSEVIYIFGFIYFIHTLIRIYLSLRPKDAENTITINQSTTFTDLQHHSEKSKSSETIYNRIFGLIEFLGIIWIIFGFLLLPEKLGFTIAIWAIGIRWAVILAIGIFGAYVVYKNQMEIGNKDMTQPPHQPKYKFNIPLNEITGLVELVALVFIFISHFG